jgi:hypothetical protein
MSTITVRYARYLIVNLVTVGLAFFDGPGVPGGN